MKMSNIDITTRPGYSAQKEAFAVLWFSYAGDGARALSELVRVDGMGKAARTIMQRKLEIDPYVRQRMAELQGFAAECAVDDARYVRDQLVGIVEDARVEGKYTSAAAALGQFIKIAGLEPTQRVDVTSGGEAITITRRIIDPKLDGEP